MVNKKVYWIGIEYRYIKKLNETKDLKGGFVYAFLLAFDVRDALQRINIELKAINLSPIEIEFISPYDLEMEWEDDKKTMHYSELYREARKSNDVVFDDFYAYEKE